MEPGDERIDGAGNEQRALLAEVTEADGPPEAIRWLKDEDSKLDFAKIAANDDAFQTAGMDEEWYDEEPSEGTTEHELAPGVPTELPSLAELLGARGARALAIIAVVTLASVVMATVLLWQRVESTNAKVDQNKEITSVPGLGGLQRRINRLETEIAAVLESPSGDASGRADKIQRQLTELNHCVAQFQHDTVAGKRSSVKYC